MNDNLKITTIGLTGAGKTCFLYAMHAKMTSGINGFTFVPEELNVLDSLDEGWDQIVINNIWPESNIQLQRFTFICNYSYQKILSFDWIDYKGGDWWTSGPEREKLLAELNESASIIFFIPAEDIQGRISNNRKADKNLRRLSALLQEYTKSNPPIPIVLSITKADKINADEIENGIKQIKEEYLNGLFMNDSDWKVLIAAVEIGQELSGGQGNQIEGNINPKNVHLPVLFPIYLTIGELLDIYIREVRSLKKERISADNAYANEINKSGWKKFWNGNHTVHKKEILDRIEGEINFTEEKIDKIRDDLHRIEEELNSEGCVVYYGGKQVVFSNI